MEATIGFGALALGNGKANGKATENETKTGASEALYRAYLWCVGNEKVEATEGLIRALH